MRRRKRIVGWVCLCFCCPAADACCPTAIRAMMRSCCRPLVRGMWRWWSLIKGAWLDLRDLCRDLLHTSWFESLAMTLVVINAAVNASKFRGMPEDMGTAIDITNRVFLAIFTLELAIRIMAQGIKAAFTEFWLAFDTIVVGASLFLVTQEEGFGVQAARAFRVARLLRFAHMSPHIRVLVDTLTASAMAILTVTLTLFLFLFVYAVAGMELYGGIASNRRQPSKWIQPYPDPVAEYSLGYGADLEAAARESGDVAPWTVNEVYRELLDDATAFALEPANRGFEGFHRHAHFRSVGPALLLMLRAATGEDWQAVFHDCWNESRWAPIFWFSFVLLCAWILLNFYVGSVLEAFERSYSQTHGSVTYQDAHRFQRTWRRFDPAMKAGRSPEYHGFIRLGDLMPMIRTFVGDYRHARNQAMKREVAYYAARARAVGLWNEADERRAKERKTNDSRAAADRRRAHRMATMMGKMSQKKLQQDAMRRQLVEAQRRQLAAARTLAAGGSAATGPLQSNGTGGGGADGEVGPDGESRGPSPAIELNPSSVAQNVAIAGFVEGGMATRERRREYARGFSSRNDQILDEAADASTVASGSTSPGVVTPHAIRETSELNLNDNSTNNNANVASCGSRVMGVLRSWWNFVVARGEDVVFAVSSWMFGNSSTAFQRYVRRLLRLRAFRLLLHEEARARAMRTEVNAILEDLLSEAHTRWRAAEKTYFAARRKVVRMRVRVHRASILSTIHTARAEAELRSAIRNLGDPPTADSVFAEVLRRKPASRSTTALNSARRGLDLALETVRSQSTLQNNNNNSFSTAAGTGAGASVDAALPKSAPAGRGGNSAFGRQSSKDFKQQQNNKPSRDIESSSRPLPRSATVDTGTATRTRGTMIGAPSGTRRSSRNHTSQHSMHAQAGVSRRYSGSVYSSLAARQQSSSVLNRSSLHPAVSTKSTLGGASILTAEADEAAEVARIRESLRSEWDLLEERLWDEACSRAAAIPRQDLRLGYADVFEMVALWRLGTDALLPRERLERELNKHRLLRRQQRRIAMAALRAWMVRWVVARRERSKAEIRAKAIILAWLHNVSHRWRLARDRAPSQTLPTPSRESSSRGNRWSS